MSKLNELIAQLCPEGVPYRSIASIITRVTEKGKDDPSVQQVYVVSNTLGLVRAEDYRENTIHSEDTSNYTVVRKNMVAYNPSRLNIGSIAMLKADEDGLVSPMYVVFSVDAHVVSYRYFEHLIKSPAVANKISSFKEEGARFRFDFSRWNWIKIPVPPVEVQNEIVRILDKFEEMNLTLTAELTARKDQYAYYQNLLLSRSAGEIHTLAECCVSIADGDHQPPPKADEGVPFITISNFSENGIDFSDTKFVPQEYYNKLDDKRRAKKDDILYSVVGSFGIPVHITEDKPFVFQRHIAILRPNTEVVVPRYLYHVMKSESFYKKADAAAIGAAQRTISLSALNRMKITVPPMDVQERLARVLDNFDTICTDLKIGLPAEIEARKKQYEFYRDQLLTFAESGKTILTDRQTDRQTSLMR